MMFLNVFDGNRAKCAKSHMQKNINNINPFSDMRESSSSVKCSPAVGAAADPFSFA